MKKVLIGCIVAVGLVIGSGGAAFAGEVNGNGKPIPGAHNASSICAFSGKDLPDSVEGNPPGLDDDSIAGQGHVQNYGKFVSNGLKAMVPSPGDVCRGNLVH